MAFCSQCGAEISADAKVCSSCGATIGQVSPVEPKVEEWDHTAEFDAEDISKNKVYALMCYATSFFGIFLAAIIAKDSAYAMFHAREATKIALVEIVVGIITGVLFWTCIVPVAAVVISIILFVVTIICFVQVCKGQAKEPWLIRSIGALH